MRTSTKRNKVARVGIYLAGMLILALGLILNTKSGMGASAIISMAYTVSEGMGWNFADMTLILYCLFVVAELIIDGKNRSWTTVLQIPLSIVFTRFMNLFAVYFTYESGYLPTDLLVLAGGIICTGIGAAITVDMQIIPNPGDGIVASVSRRIGKELGLTKNFFDIGCVTISVVMGLCFGNPLLGVGLGTFLSMIGVGRVIALFNHLCKSTLQRVAGISS